MTIIVAGKLTIRPGSRDDFIERFRELILQARNNEACEDFPVSPYPVGPGRVNIFEKWKNCSALTAFRESGSESDIFSLVASFDVNEYVVNT